MFEDDGVAGAGIAETVFGLVAGGAVMLIVFSTIIGLCVQAAHDATALKIALACLSPMIAGLSLLILFGAVALVMLSVQGLGVLMRKAGLPGPYIWKDD